MFGHTKEVSEYLRKIQQGDRSQCEPLYNITAMHLRCVAQSYLQNKGLADDVVSEAFIKIILYINSYDCSQDGYNWMCKITQNMAYTYNVNEGKIAESERRFAQDRQLITDDDFNEVEFFMQMDVLDDDDKQIAIARFLFGMTLQDIGKRYNVSRAAVCQRVKRICKIIKKNYKKD